MGHLSGGQVLAGSTPVTLTMEDKLGRAQHRLEGGWHVKACEFRVLCLPLESAVHGAQPALNTGVR